MGRKRVELRLCNYPIFSGVCPKTARTGTTTCENGSVESYFGLQAIEAGQRLLSPSVPP